MSSSSPNPAEALDGPNKKCRVQELIHLPDSLDDAMLQPATTTTQQQLPADEASRALVTLQLGSADDSSPRRRVGGPGPAASTAVVCASNAIQTVAAAAQQTEITLIPTRGTGEAVTKAAAKRAESTARLASYHRETSQEPAPSDPGTCVSLDIAAGSSALEALGCDDGEAEVVSRAVGAGAAGSGLLDLAEGFEVFIGGLAPDSRQEDVRAALAELGQGEVLSVRLQMTRGTSICKGYGFATFADKAAAQRALAAAGATLDNPSAASDGGGAVTLCGRRVGLHASRRPFRSALSAAQAAGGMPSLPLAAAPGASMSSLLSMLRSLPDRKAAVAAALQVVQRGSKRPYTAAAVPALPDGVVVDRGGAANGAAAPAAAGVGAAGAGDAATGGSTTARLPGTATAGKRPATTEAIAAPVTTAAAVVANGVKTEPAAAAPALAPAGAKPTAAAPAAAATPAGAAPAAAPAGAKSTGGSGDAEGRPGTAGGKKQAPAAGGGQTAPAAPGAGGGGGAAPGNSADLTAALAAYPKVQKLLQSLKGTTRVPKTPLMILHEYATKMSYDVTYTETCDGPAGPYSVEVRLTSGGSQGPAVVTAVGKARTKKDAKQVSAAACLEKLMDGPRGVTPYDLLPASKQPPGAGRQGRQSDRSGVGYQSSNAVATGKKTSTASRPNPATQPASYQPHSGYHGPPRGERPPPQPTSHSQYMAPRGYTSGPPMPSLPPYSGPMGRGPFSGGGGGGGGGGNSGNWDNGGASGYSFVQPGLMPANTSSSSGAKRGAGGGREREREREPYGGPAPSEGRGGQGRGMRGAHGDQYGGGAVASGGYGGLGQSVGPGGGGSMVQLGLDRGLGGNVGAAAQSGPYGSLYDRDGGGAAGGNGLGLNEPYGSMSSYDMAAGQKRNYSTAMQAFGPTPTSGAFMGNSAPQQTQPLQSLQPRAGLAANSSAFGNPGLAAAAPQQQQSLLSGRPMQQQQAVGGGSGVTGGGGIGLYNMGQMVQLQPAQPQPLFTNNAGGQSTAGVGQLHASSATGMYGMSTSAMQSVVHQQPQQYQPQQTAMSGVSGAPTAGYGGLQLGGGQQPQGGAFGAFGAAGQNTVQQQQQQTFQTTLTSSYGQQPQQQQFGGFSGMAGTGLQQTFGSIRQGGGLWG